MKDTKTYDLSLGKWGPYNKDYLGVCHIANGDLGATFNVELFPGMFRRTILACPTSSDTGVKMWGANPNLTHFVYRYELEWKDKVYVDAHFNITDDKVVHIDCVAVNDTDYNQSINMNLCASFQYPYRKDISGNKVYYKRYKALVNKNNIYINALDYYDIKSSVTMAKDGKYLSENMGDNCTGGYTYIDGKTFFDKSHYIKYSCQSPLCSVGIRYRCEEDTFVTLIAGDKEYRIELAATNDFAFKYVNIDRYEGKDIIITPSGVGVDIDCIILGDDVSDTVFAEDINAFEPVTRTLEDNKLCLKYEHSPYTYVIEWKNDADKIRRLYTDDAGKLLQKKIHDHVSDILGNQTTEEVVYENIFTNPIYLKPRSKGKFSFKLTSVENSSDLYITKKNHPLYSVSCNSDGEKYAFSQNLMSYNAMLNVVYPIYTRRGFIRHNTPGRIWDSLYSWDSGFIGMGLGVSDFERAYQCLNTYLTPVGDIHSPYIFHGSVVPIQIFLYAELINKYPGKKEELKKLYPMIQQYYDFYSRLDKRNPDIKTGLLKTWDIFYNSGGWDDYPPQKALRYGLDREDESACYDNTTPVITTAVTVLIAKIMMAVSEYFGIEDNKKQYTDDIRKYTQAINEHLWDDEVGYYSYMVHDKSGNAKGFLRYKDSTNYNMGFDGIYPYIAGISDEYKSERIKENISKGLMTKYGVCVVDKRAPYYTPYGYWNGSVWMPHQWILYKALLDRGEIKLASKIAQTALDVWKDECDNTYSCFEHFMTTNGRGSGFHQFSGLSCPVLQFFSALYVPGNINTGFGTVINDYKYNKNKTDLKLDITCYPDNSYIVICMSENNEYEFVINGKIAKPVRITNGAYAIKCVQGKNNIKVNAI